MINELQPDITLPKNKKIKVYTALLTQTGTSNPTATILQNTTGLTFTWLRTGVGLYSAAGTYDILKTSATIEKNVYNRGFTINIPSTSSISIITLLNTTTAADDVLNNTLVEIKIYDI